MHCNTFGVSRFVVLCWTACIFRAQLVNNQQIDISNNHGSSYFFYQRPVFPRDCEEVRNQCSSETSNGIYLIKPDGYPEPFEVYCNNTNLDGWTVLLRRNDGFLDFYRTWNEYKDGFGFLSQEFWIGNEKLSYLTNQNNYELRIDFTSSHGSSCYVSYDLFRTIDGVGDYKIAILGQYSGNADDGITLCPSNMEPGDCNCQKTCANQSGCVNACDTDDTCICFDGFYLKGEECVPLNECTSGCSVSGVNIPEDGFYVNDDCTRRGVCKNNIFIWDNNFMCTANEVCEERNNVRQCYSNAVDCLDIYNAGFTDNGVYTIKPTIWPESPFQVYCNMTDGGGWTVFQRRVDGAVDFYRNWTSYKEGFGSPDHEHWLGNDKLSNLTNQKRYTLRIDFVNLDESPYFIKYDFFRINDEIDNYRISQLGSASGDAGNSLSYHYNQQFSTHDQDHDSLGNYNCAVYENGAWWYKSCSHSNLNGLYRTTSGCYDDYIYWYTLPGSNCNKFVEMKIRPL